jgi:hypothetical protein
MCRTDPHACLCKVCWGASLRGSGLCACCSPISRMSSPASGRLDACVCVRFVYGQGVGQGVGWAGRGRQKERARAHALRERASERTVEGPHSAPRAAGFMQHQLSWARYIGMLLANRYARAHVSWCCINLYMVCCSLIDMLARALSPLSVCISLVLLMRARDI